MEISNKMEQHFCTVHFLCQLCHNFCLWFLFPGPIQYRFHMQQLSSYLFHGLRVHTSALVQLIINYFTFSHFLEPACSAFKTCRASFIALTISCGVFGWVLNNGIFLLQMGVVLWVFLYYAHRLLSAMEEDWILSSVKKLSEVLTILL